MQSPRPPTTKETCLSGVLGNGEEQGPHVLHKGLQELGKLLLVPLQEQDQGLTDLRWGGMRGTEGFV